MESYFIFDNFGLQNRWHRRRWNKKAHHHNAVRHLEMEQSPRSGLIYQYDTRGVLKGLYTLMIYSGGYSMVITTKNPDRFRYLELKHFMTFVVLGGGRHKLTHKPSCLYKTFLRFLGYKDKGGHRTK